MIAWLLFACFLNPHDDLVLPEDTGDTSDTDGGEDTADTAVDTDLPDWSSIGNLDPTAECERTFFSPPNEAKSGWPIAVKFDLSVDFDVHAVQVPLYKDRFQCFTVGEWSVDLFVDAGDAPPASPTLARSGTAVPPATGPSDDRRLLTVVFDQPLKASAGDRVWAMIHFGDGDQSCVYGCQSTDGPETDYTAQSDGAPYTWRSLRDYGWPGTTQVLLLGE